MRVISGAPYGFRHRARLAIRGRVGAPKLGMFELGSHRLVHIPRCRVQHPLINRVAAVVRGALIDARVSTYSERAHLGLARYLQVAVERGSQSAQMVIVANSATSEPLTAFMELIRERLGGQLHSLWFNANQGRSNVILGDVFERWCGPASVVERFGGAAVHYPPGAFGQSNLEIAQAIIEHLREQIPQGARVAEFYAGVGAIGLSVLARVSALTMNEVAVQSLLGLDLALSALGPADQAKVSIVPGVAGGALAAAAGAQVMIADPPRKGLDPQLLEWLRAEPPERFLYISCGLESFIRDLARLTGSGRLRLCALDAFNLFPFTEHVETVARFERA